MTYDSEITNEVSSFCGQVKQITMAIKIGFYSVCNLDFECSVYSITGILMSDTPQQNTDLELDGNNSSNINKLNNKIEEVK